MNAIPSVNDVLSGYGVEGVVDSTRSSANGVRPRPDEPGKRHRAEHIPNRDSTLLTFSPLPAQEIPEISEATHGGSDSARWLRDSARQRREWCCYHEPRHAGDCLSPEDRWLLMCAESDGPEYGSGGEKQRRSEREGQQARYDVCIRHQFGHKITGWTEDENRAPRHGESTCYCNGDQIPPP